MDKEWGMPPDGTSRTSGTSRTGGATAARRAQRGTGPNGIRPSGLTGEMGEGQQADDN